MSDETPAGGDPHYPGGGPPPPPHGGPYQEWPHEAPPGMGPQYGAPQRDPHAVSRGVKAAALIFAVSVAVHLLTLAAVAISGDGNNAGFFIPEGLFVVFVGLVAAVVVSMKLPLESRAAFWISGVAFMALQFIIWGVTCGIGLSVSPVNFN